MISSGIDTGFIRSEETAVSTIRCPESQQFTCPVHAENRPEKSPSIVQHLRSDSKVILMQTRLDCHISRQANDLIRIHGDKVDDRDQHKEADA